MWRRIRLIGYFLWLDVELGGKRIAHWWKLLWRPEIRDGVLV
jgi:hypothetical protein